MSGRSDPWFVRTLRGPGLVVAVSIVAAVLLRFIDLANDPVHPNWLGWQQDEGRWTASARSWVLFRELGDNGVSTIHLALASLWQAVCAGFFGVFGVGFVPARLPSALAGSAVVVALAVGLRGHVRPMLLAAGVMLVAFDPALVYFSRVAIPEMLSILWQLLAFLTLVRMRESNRSALCAGLFALLALATKATTAPAVVGLLGALAVMHRSRPDARATRAALFAGITIGVPLVLVGAVLLIRNATPEVGQLLTFVRLNSIPEVLTTLHASGRGISSGDPSAVNLLLAGVWTVGVSLLPWRSGAFVSEAERTFRGAVCWAGGTLVAWSLSGYFPDRWVVQIHLPLVIALVSGISALTAAPAPAHRSASSHDWRRVRDAGLLLPPAVLLASWLVPLLAEVGWDLDRIRWQLALVMIVWGALAGGVRPGREDTRAALLAGMGLIALLAWRLDAGVLPHGAFWATAEGSLARRTLVLLIGGGAGLASWRLVLRNRPGHPLARTLSVFAWGLAALWLGFGISGRPAGSQTLAETARYLEQHYPDETWIGVESAATVMLGVPVPYRDARWATEGPDVLVVMIGGGWGRPVERPDVEGYRAVFEVPLPRLEGGSTEPAWLRIYERTTRPQA